MLRSLQVEEMQYASRSFWRDIEGDYVFPNAITICLRNISELLPEYTWMRSVKRMKI
jgi:hypothetical protein